MLGNRHCHTTDIGLLEGIGSQKIASHLAGDSDDGGGVQVGVGKRNLGIQQLGSQARSYGLTQKRGRQVLVQEEKADQQVHLRFAVRGERNWCGFAAEEGLGNLRT